MTWPWGGPLAMMLDLQISSEENHSHHPKNPAGLGYSAFRCALDLVRGEGGMGLGMLR